MSWVDVPALPWNRDAETVDDAPPVHPRPGAGGFPLLIAAFVQGLPLNLTLYSRETPSLDRLYEDNLQVATSAGNTSVLPLLVWGTLYVVALAALLRGRPVGLRTRAYTVLAGLLVLIVASSSWTRYPQKTYFVAAHAAGAMLIATAAAVRYRGDPGALASALGRSLGVAVLLHVAVAVAAPRVGIDWEGRWAGLCATPNSFAMLCVCGAWANLSALALRASRRRALHLTFAVVAAGGVLGANSITSAATLVVIAAVVLAAWSPARRAPVRTRHLRTAFVVAGATLASVIGLIAMEAGWERVTRTLGRSADATGRTTLWGTALELIDRRPLLGWGFDENATVMEVSGFSYTHFHNGLLDVAVRGGVVALALVLSIVAVVLVGALVAGRDERTLWLPLAAALLVHNATEVSLLASRNVLWMLALVAFVMFSFRERSRSRASPLATTQAIG